MSPALEQSLPEGVGCVRRNVEHLRSVALVMEGKIDVAVDIGEGFLTANARSHSIPDGRRKATRTSSNGNDADKDEVVDSFFFFTSGGA